MMAVGGERTHTRGAYLARCLGVRLLDLLRAETGGTQAWKVEASRQNSQSRHNKKLPVQGRHTYANATLAQEC